MRRFGKKITKESGLLKRRSNRIMHRDKILIIDYGIGNHQSVANALRFLGYDFFVSSKKEDILSADSYILPGVGAFGEAMKNLERLGMIELLNQQVLEKRKNILGICLGMQIFAEYSLENGRHEGLGWIEGFIDRIAPRDGLRVPHVGWNNLQIVNRDPLFLSTSDENSFYFDHSYHFLCADKQVAAYSEYGDRFVAAVHKENIIGVQFHPEKSQRNGLKLFRCYLNYLEKGVKRYA